MTDITITRWAKYGHDRGYATAADGTTLGWIDRKTGVVTLADGADVASVTDALVAWSGTSLPTPIPASAPFDALVDVAPHVVEGAPVPSVVEPESVDEAFATLPNPGPSVPPPTPARSVKRVTRVEPEWTDLAAHRPGQLVREQAAAKWEADKAESKLFAYGSRFFDAKTDERAWRVGTEGEEYIGAKLDRLRDRGWYVLHSVPVGKRGSDIDHVVIGPGGVFTVNTKNHHGKKIWVGRYQIRVNGRPVTYLRDARFEAERASKAISRAVGGHVAI